MITIGILDLPHIPSAILYNTSLYSAYILCLDMFEVFGLGMMRNNLTTFEHTVQLRQVGNLHHVTV